MDIWGAAPFAIVTALVGWIGAAWKYRDAKRDKKEEKDDRLEIHQDNLTFQLLQAARSEVSVAYTEMKGVREELRNLRDLEKHFFYFQQSLDHLEAVLFAETPAIRKIAERAAIAFLKRMRRLNSAKGTIRNEVQASDSTLYMADRKITDIEDGILPQKPEDV